CSVLAVEKPDMIDSKLRACGAGFHFADVGKGSGVLPKGFVGAIATTSSKYNGDSLVQIVDGPGEVWSDCAFVIGMRDNDENVGFKAVVGFRDRSWLW